MAAKKAGTKKTQTRKATPSSENSFEQLVHDLKEVLYAGLGVYGKLYDEFNSRMECARKDRSKNWKVLVTRGEKLYKDIDKKVKNFDGELTFEVPVYVDLDELRANVEERIEELKSRFTPADA